MHLKSVDLNNFPTSPTAQRMIGRVSPIYDRSYVAKWLYQVMGLELDDMKFYVKTYPLQRFPETATWGLRYLEQKNELPVDESLDIQERRARIIAKRPYRGSVTPFYIEQLLYDLFGVEASVEEHNSEYYFDILFDDSGLSLDIMWLIAEVKRVKPSHLAFGISASGVLPQQNLYTGTILLLDSGCDKIEPHIEETPPIESAEYTGVVLIEAGNCTFIEPYIEETPPIESKTYTGIDFITISCTRVEPYSENQNTENQTKEVI